MNKFRPIILAFSVVAAALLAYGFLTMPKPRPADHDGFSSARVLEDIEIISRAPHSVAHPEELAKVREHLVGRLEEMGGDVTLYKYDSVPGAWILGDSFVFEAVDIVAEFPPLNPSDDTAYLMFIAHYDSRHILCMPKDTVLSFGAADDGYGLGVTLETVSQLLKDRGSWSQGVKVLFTDGEESGMQGMKYIWDRDHHVFDNVGLVINVEARGTWGPALMFETGKGNEKVMDLYASAARSPYTYSLTDVVYEYMPNRSDFTICKDVLPGVNFSTIADINTYHTDEDNFANVSERSIQHFGAQILPFAQSYLTDPEYADKNALRGEKDTVNFTIPLLGIFNVSKTVYLIINIAIFLLFFVLFGFEGLRGRIKAMKVFKSSCITLFIAIGVLAVGELIAYLCAVISGATFKPFGIIQGIFFDNAVMLVSIIFLVLSMVLVYWSARNNAVRQTSGSMRASAASNAASKYVLHQLYGTLALMFVFCAALVFTFGENFMLLVPFAVASIALLMWRVTNLKVWLLAAVVIILLHAFSFLFVLAMALTIGAFGVVAMLAFFDLMVLIPLADLYLMPERIKK